jgi:hypothetical protein
MEGLELKIEEMEFMNEKLLNKDGIINDLHTQK